MTRHPFFPRVIPARLLLCIAAILMGTFASAGAQASPDSVSPVFRSDSSKIEAIRKVEAGAAGKDSARTMARSDSLRIRLKRRGPYAGLSAGIAFAEHSAGDLFTAQMLAERNAKGERELQRQDPVHVFFPGGLLLGFPLLRQFDAQLRSEHFYYKVKGLAQRNNEAPSEYWYSQQAHFAGAGLRWLVPISLLTVNGKPGLYAAYTHFWSFGPTGIRSPHGSLRAQTDPAGAGYEVQLGFQQDFDKRWTLVGGLAFSRLTLRSDADWTNVAPNVPAAGQAEWTMQSMRFAMQGLYQFGRSGKR